MKIFQKTAVALIAFLAIMCLQSCVKDTLTTTYTYETPILTPKATVLQNIKSTAAQPMINTGKIVQYGNLILVNEINKGVHIINNSNPAAPVNQEFIAIPGNLDIAVRNNILFADIYTDMVTIDISNRGNAVFKKLTNNVFSSRRYGIGYYYDSTKYITGWEKHTTTDKEKFEFFNNKSVDFAFSSSPTTATNTTGINGSTTRMCITGDFLYAVDQYSLTPVDIQDLLNPIAKTSQTVGFNIETIYPFKNKLFIGGQTGMYIYDIANAAQPARQGSFVHACFNDPVIADGDFAYVTLKARTTTSPCWGAPAAQTNELNVVDVRNITNPTLVRMYNMAGPSGLSKDGNTLFICDGIAGLKIYNATNPADLKLLKTIVGITPQDVIAANGIAMVVAKEGIYQYDYSNINDIKKISHLPISIK